MFFPRLHHSVGVLPLQRLLHSWHGSTGRFRMYNHCLYRPCLLIAHLNNRTTTPVASVSAAETRLALAVAHARWNTNLGLEMWCIYCASPCNRKIAQGVLWRASQWFAWVSRWRVLRTISKLSARLLQTLATTGTTTNLVKLSNWDWINCVIGLLPFQIVCKFSLAFAKSLLFSYPAWKALQTACHVSQILCSWLFRYTSFVELWICVW